MKTISIFILLIYWSIMIFAPVMSNDLKLSRVKLNTIKIKSKNYEVNKSNAHHLYQKQPQLRKYSPQKRANKLKM